MEKTIGYNTHFNYGSGVDSSSEDIRGMAVIPTEPSKMIGAAGTDVTYMTHIVESQRELEETIGVSAAMSLNYGFVAGGSAKVDFAQSNALNDYSLALVVSIQVKNPVLLMSGVKLTQESKDLFSKSPELFKARYGDSYVNGILTGGEMYGLIVIHTKSSSQKSSLSTSLNASGHFGLTSVQLDASTKQNISEATKDSDVSVFVHTSGFTFDVYPQTVEDLLNCAAKFPNGVATSGKATPYAMDLMEYKYLDLPDGPNLYDLQNRDDVIQFCAQLKSLAITKRASIQYILQSINTNPDSFLSADPEKLVLYVNQLNELLDKIHTRISGCFNDWHKCEFGKDDLLIPVMNLPIPKPSSPSAPIDYTKPFEGKWDNNTPGGALTRMIITPTDTLHATVRANYHDFPGDFVSTAQWSEEDKALVGSVTLRPGVSSGKLMVPAESSGYQIRTNGSENVSLVVTNNQGHMRSTKNFTDIFQRTGA